ncbi:MAG: M17 family peptidase N-terminal domain-containing protein, partial [Myxococcota bacterium]|nr:M17 family peptidase N-terminal domain-containing protein [Myxococcota bacterium]
MWFVLRPFAWVVQDLGRGNYTSYRHAESIEVPMNVSLHSSDLSNLSAPLLAIPVFADEGQRGELFTEIDGLLQGVPGKLADEEGFDGKPGQTLLIHSTDSNIRRVMLVGVGKAESLKVADLRKISAAAVQEADRRKLASVAVALPPCNGASDGDRIRFGTEGGVLGAYRYETYLTQDVEPMTCEEVVLLGANDADAESIISVATAVSEGVNLARDLVNGPPVEVTPSRMADVARSIAADDGLEVTIFDKAEIKRQGMNLLMAVSAGSEQEPRFIHLTYRPEGANEDTPQVAFVGKGLTYDAGGFNLKPAAGLEDMKMDMAGGAAVLGAMKAVSAVKPNYIVHGIVP